MWTMEHLITLLPAVIVYIIIAFVLRVFLKNKSDRVKMIPSMVIGVILLGLEITKQIYNIIIGYEYKILPLYFCSQFCCLIPLMAFYFGKHKYVVRNVATTASMMMFLFLMLYPSSIYSEVLIKEFFNNFTAFHAVIFHNLVVLNLFIVIALSLNEFKSKRDVIANLITFGAYCVIAGILSQVLQTNFNNFYTNIVGWAEDIRLAFINQMGAFGQALYVIIFSILILIGSLFAYFVVRLIDHLINWDKKDYKLKK